MHTVHNAERATRQNETTSYRIAPPRKSSPKKSPAAARTIPAIFIGSGHSVSEADGLIGSSSVMIVDESTDGMTCEYARSRLLDEAFGGSSTRSSPERMIGSDGSAFPAVALIPEKPRTVFFFVRRGGAFRTPFLASSSTINPLLGEWNPVWFAQQKTVFC